MSTTDAYITFRLPTGEEKEAIIRKGETNKIMKTGLNLELAGIVLELHNAAEKDDKKTVKEQATLVIASIKGFLDLITDDITDPKFLGIRLKTNGPRNQALASDVVEAIVEFDAFVKGEKYRLALSCKTKGAVPQTSTTHQH